MSLTAQIKSVISKQTQWKITACLFFWVTYLKQYKSSLWSSIIQSIKKWGLILSLCCFLLQATDPEDTQTKGMKMGVITVVEDDVATIHSNQTVRCLSVVLEEQVYWP